jgi:arylformamidase
MKIIDISWPITPEMTGYKDAKSFRVSTVATFEKKEMRETVLSMSSHAGTHIDAPAHFVKNGKTIDQIALDAFVGPCTVLDLTSVQGNISEQDLKNQPINENNIILLKTTNSTLSATAPFHYEFVALDKSGAHYLISKKIKTVGIDYLGIERDQPGHPTHIDLMKNNITIIEGLRLENVEPGSYDLYCLPLAVKNLEAAPVRAILIQK